IATDTTLVEGTHGQLGTRLTNGLCSNNTDSLSDINLLAGSHGLAVALSTNTGWGLAGKYGTNLDVLDASLDQKVNVELGQVGTSSKHNLACSVGCIASKNTPGDRSLDQVKAGVAGDST